MAGIDYESEYNSRKKHPEHADLGEKWDALATVYREEADAELDIPYGPSERQRYDLFHPAGAESGGKGLLVYIHGGYWRMRDRKSFSHVARAFNRRGITVAIPSYDLCPNVTVLDIVDEMRAFLRDLWRRTRARPVVAGHSAGGHLAAAMLATDWRATGETPDDMVRAAFAVSGIYDLDPLRHTSMNDDLKLTEETARAASPLFWDPPAARARLVAAVGDAESDAFKRQSRALVEAWDAHGVRTELLSVPQANHFTVIEPLMVEDSAMIGSVCALIGDQPGG